MCTSLKVEESSEDAADDSLLNPRGIKDEIARKDGNL